MENSQIIILLKETLFIIYQIVIPSIFPTNSNTVLSAITFPILLRVSSLDILYCLLWCQVRYFSALDILTN